jgi:hypothetical protein
MEIAGTIKSEESARFVYVFMRKGIDRDGAKKAPGYHVLVAAVLSECEKLRETSKAASGL